MDLPSHARYRNSVRIHRVIASLFIAFALAAGVAKGGDAPVNADFDARLNKVVELEERAQFPDAIALCAETEKAFHDQPALLERLQIVSTRLREERRAAEDLGFASSSLIDPESAAVAEQRYREFGEVGRILLRKAFREGPEALSLKACAILLDLKDRQLAWLCAERLAANPQDPQRAKWIKVMWASIAKVDPRAFPAIYNQVADPELARYLVAAVRRTGDDGPEAFARLTHDGAAYDLLKQRGVLAEDPTDALTVHLKFLEKTGTQAANSVGEKRPAATIQGAKWEEGKAGALAFTGSEIVTLDDKALEIGRFNADFSVTFWLWLNVGPKNGWRNITHKGNSDEERTFAIWLHPDDNRMHYRIGTMINGNEGGDNPTEVPQGKWTHIAYIKRGHVLELYIDGRKDTEAELSAGTVHNTGPVYIGKDPWYGGINGMIGDYRIYTRALLKSELTLLSAHPPQ